MNLKKDQDIYLGIVILIIFSILWSQLLKIKGNAAMLPKMFLILMLISGIGIISNAIVKNIKTGQAYKKMSIRILVWEVGIPGIWLCLICFLFNYIGFYICSFIFIIGICLMQNYLINEKVQISVKHTLKLLLFSFCSTLFMFLFFHVFLGVQTPIGFLGF